MKILKFFWPVIYFNFNCVFILTINGSIVYSGSEDIVLMQNSGDSAVFGDYFNAIHPFEVSDMRTVFTAAQRQNNTGFHTVFEQNWILSFDKDTIIMNELEWDPLNRGALLSYEGASMGMGHYFDKNDQYLILRKIMDENVFFGWMRISHSVAEERLVIHDWAWNSAPGEPILAGQIPEPRTAVLLTGLCALLAAVGWRWRRR